MAERKLKIREKISQNEPKLPDAVIPEGNDDDVDLDFPPYSNGESAGNPRKNDSELKKASLLCVAVIAGKRNPTGRRSLCPKAASMGEIVAAFNEVPFPRRDVKLGIMSFLSANKYKILPARILTWVIFFTYGLMSARYDTDVEANAQNPNERGGWGLKIEFILSCVAFAVGLGNVWRFPYLCFKNGGGAFLVPYVIMLICLGLPIFFLEFAFGQFASLGPISIWSISPLFKGVGYAMTTVSWYISLYYNVIIATAFFYLFASFNKQLPWSTCDNWWNNNFTCQPIGAPPSDNATSPAVEYYNGFEDFGTPVWHITLCLLFSWIVVVLSLIKGVQSLGKVSYFTAIFPYIMLTILLVRAATLEGSLEGVKYYVTPDFSRLSDPTAWTDAATQIIFSLSCCNGGLIAMSSYNKFKNNCYRDAVLVATINCLTSVFAGFVVFSTLGFMANAKGPGLVFMVYPEALNQMPVPVLWSILFFIMLVSLGLGSELPYVETVLSAFQDELRRYNLLTTWKSQFLFRVVLCSINFLITLPMVCPAGVYLVNLMDNVMSGYPVLIICLMELIVISYVYGIKQFMRDVKLMIDSKPNWYWRICWMGISPLMVLALLIFMIVGGKPFGLGNYIFPTGIQVMGQLIAIVPIVMIVGFFVYKYCRDGGWILLREFSKPVTDWGPAEDEHRTEFLQGICKRTLGYVPSDLRMPGDGDGEGEEGKEGGANHLNVSQVWSTGAGGSTTALRTAASCQALHSLLNEGEFYQSKLSIAEKMAELHTKDLVKQGVPIELLASTDRLKLLTNSVEELREHDEQDGESEGSDAEDKGEDVPEGEKKPSKMSHLLRRIQRKSSSGDNDLQ
ncbi:Sodium- and chloride-dependent glycine transporter [Echinococcus granulosus]|uniref:Transporter n=1 Tax=Echinococcus granulosus TaxID=6210 RepID=W6UNL2_ECHGR|nr:Sodium- and chloride-dependent glycine transporter [Echinococcus granulosus]EUB63240.1 Sodium- and chloride-dependent glycine transporter [Echinococcus granulosus]